MAWSKIFVVWLLLSSTLTIGYCQPAMTNAKNTKIVVKILKIFASEKKQVIKNWKISQINQLGKLLIKCFAK